MRLDISNAEALSMMFEYVRAFGWYFSWLGKYGKTICNYTMTESEFNGICSTEHSKILIDLYLLCVAYLFTAPAFSEAYNVGILYRNLIKTYLILCQINSSKEKVHKNLLKNR
jgi:hypothetical protein